VGARSTDSEGLQLVKSEKILKTGAWVHLAGTVELATNAITLYVNGTPVPTTGAVKFAQKTFPNTPSSFGVIGAEDDGSRYYFNGPPDLHPPPQPGGNRRSRHARPVAALVPHNNSGPLPF
jgi:hypothetical protein